jgi:hypothetical protein
MTRLAARRCGPPMVRHASSGRTGRTRWPRWTGPATKGSEWWEGDEGGCPSGRSARATRHPRVVAGLMRVWLAAVDRDRWQVLTGRTGW